MGTGQARTAQPQRESAGATRRMTPAVATEVKSPLDPLREAQQFLGNQGILKRIQAKLTVNQPGDVFEQEADRVADAVMAKPAGMAAVAVNNVPAVGAVQRTCASCEGGGAKCASCEEEEKRVMRKESGSAAVPVAGAAVTRVLNSPGQSLDRSTRNLMESRFGFAFGDVRVHTGMEAAQSAREIAANAYTVGNDVVFNDGQYKPWSREGQRLLAHELTHVLQQRECGAGQSSSQKSNAGQATKSAIQGNAFAQRVAIRESSGIRIARDEDKTPWWKKKLNPLYQAALEKLPKEAAEKLEQANAVAKEFVQSTGLSDQAIDQAVQVAEPVLKPLEDKFGVTNPVAPPPKKEDKTPVVWLGQPPIDVRLQQRREQKAAQDKLDQTDPGALAPPVKKNVTQDTPDQSHLLREDPPPTEFESKLRSGKKFTHTLTPHADIRPSKAIWLGHRPPDSQLDSIQYIPVGMPSSTKIWEHDRSFDVQISGDDVTPVRDSVTHELKGYRFHLTGETIAELNRNGEILQSRGTERPLETPVVDPIDAALLVFDLGPLAAKGIQAGGKALLDAALKSGTRELGEVGVDEAGSVASRKLHLPELDLGGVPANDVEPFTGAPKDLAAAEDNVIYLDDFRQTDLEEPNALQIAEGQDFGEQTLASARPRKGGGSRSGSTVPRSGAGTSSNESGLRIPLSKSRVRRLGMAENADKWTDLEGTDRTSLGKAYNTILQKITRELASGGRARVQHYVQVNKKMISDLAEEGGRVVITEGQLPNGTRFDIAEIDFEKKTVELLDLTAMKSGPHSAKTGDYANALNKLTGFRVNSYEARYVGNDARLANRIIFVRAANAAK